jgi:phosphate starvation-inducible PhoH-like protein
MAADVSLSLHDFFPKLQLLSSGKRQVTPKSLNQRRYIEAIRRNDIVFGIGPGGTGKTFLAVAMALTYLLEKGVARIILTRPAVEAGEKLGFLPGESRKINFTLRLLYDALYILLESERFSILWKPHHRTLPWLSCEAVRPMMRHYSDELKIQPQSR